MENPPNTNNQFLKQLLGKALGVGLLVILLVVAGFFIVTKGSDIVSNGLSNAIQEPEIIVPLAAGAVVATGLGIVGAPLMVAVGVGIVVCWLFARSLIH